MEHESESGLTSPYVRHSDGLPEGLTFSARLTLLGRRSRQSIYELLRRDPSFPRLRQIGSEFFVGWLRAEGMEWLNSRPDAELNGLEAAARQKRLAFVRKRRSSAALKNRERRTSLELAEPH